MRYLITLAFMLSACDIAEELDNTPPDPPKVIKIRRCAQDSLQAADTANFTWCEPRPPGGAK